MWVKCQINFTFHDPDGGCICGAECHEGMVTTRDIKDQADRAMVRYIAQHNRIYKTAWRECGVVSVFYCNRGFWKVASDREGWNWQE